MPVPALTWLVGMLTVGTALPQSFACATVGMSMAMPMIWQLSVLAGGRAAWFWFLVMPHLSESVHGWYCGPSLKDWAGLHDSAFLSWAGGYFGHCWELYTFWMLVPWADWFVR